MKKLFLAIALLVASTSLMAASFVTAPLSIVGGTPSSRPGSNKEGTNQLAYQDQAGNFFWAVSNYDSSTRRVYLMVQTNMGAYSALIFPGAPIMPVPQTITNPSYTFTIYNVEWLSVKATCDFTFPNHKFRVNIAYGGGISIMPIG